MADGTQISRAVSECHSSLLKGEGHMPVTSGEAGDEDLMHAVKLEILGLVLHIFERTLKPMRMMLA
jgi:hypothetical protein